MRIRDGFAWCGLLAITAYGLCARQTASPAALTRASEVRNLPPEEARKALPVHLRGTVSFVDPGPGEIFVQDETAGVFVFEHESESDAPIHPGLIVELTGVTTAADFAPGITKAHLHVCGAGPLPKPKRRLFEELVGGKEDGQWFEIDGVVRSGHLKGGRLFLSVATVGGSFVAILPEFPRDWNQRLVDARVSIRGVLAAVFNERRQSAGVRMFVPGPEYVHINEQGPPDVFSLPVSDANSVGRFHPLEQLSRRIRARTTVVGLDPGVAMYVADPTGSLEVQPIPGCAAQPGDLIDVAGFPGVIEGRPGLQDSLCRKIGTGFPLPVSDVNVTQILPPTVQTDPSGYGFAAGTRWDGSLVRLNGTLLGNSDHPEAATWLLKSGTQTFTATLPAFSGQQRPEFETGSLLRVTGVCLITYDPYHRAQFFRLLLRSPGDVAILARPSWWTFEHSAWTLGLLGLICLVAVGWIYVLRHQVATRTQQLFLVNERLTELSTRDPLTHTFNRRHFDQTLACELQRSSRSGQLLSLILLDIDHFKSLNDIYGHQEGDQCLIRVVRALENAVRRSGDLVARYGGEEFTVILAETGPQGAMQVAEKIRAAVAALAIPHSGSRTEPFVTISAGVTSWDPSTTSNARSLIAAADRALYEAKRQGRNRVVFFSSMQAEAQEDVATSGPSAVEGLNRAGK